MGKNVDTWIPFKDTLVIWLLPQHLRVDLCEGDCGTGFPVDQAAETGFPLDDAVGHPHLAAQGRQEDHQL